MQKVSMIVFSAVTACFVAIVAVVLWTSVKNTSPKENKTQVSSKVKSQSKKVAKKVKKQNVEITETKIELTPEYQAMINDLDQSESKPVAKKEIMKKSANSNKVVYFQKNPETSLYQEQSQ